MPLLIGICSHITQAAKDSGAPDAMASNATWALGVGAGSIPNMLFVFYKLNKVGSNWHLSTLTNVDRTGLGQHTKTVNMA